MAKTEHFIEVEGLFNVCRTTNRPTVGETVCAEDGEFMLAARYWDGGLRLVIGAQTLELSVSSGRPDPDAALRGGVIELSPTRRYGINSRSVTRAIP